MVSRPYPVRCLLTALLLLALQPAAAQDSTRVTRGTLVIENVPPVPEALAERLRQYNSTRSAGVVGWAPDGQSLLVRTRFAQTAQLHRVSQPLGMRKQLTFFDEPVGEVAVCPDPARALLLFTKDVGGNEYRQIYTYDLGSGAYAMVTDGGKTQNGSIVWSRDGRHFAYSSTRRNGRDYDIYLARAEAPEQARLVMQNSGLWAPVDFSPDGKTLLVRNYRSVAESYLWLLDVATGQPRQFNPSRRQIAYGAARFSGDGKGLYYVSDERTEFQKLRYWDLARNRSTTLTTDLDWDVEDLAATRDGGLLAYTANVEGESQVFLLDAASNTSRRVTTVPPGITAGLDFSPDGKFLAMTLNRATAPADAYVLDVATSAVVRWTESETGGLDAAQFVSPELVRYPTFDEATKGQRRTVPAFVYRPKGPAAGAKRAVLVNIHGGPEGQSQPGFSSYVQFLVNELGIVVVSPNVRGSTGYGKTYTSLDNALKREESVRDIGALLDWIATQPDLDTNRVMVWGGSYGGYMVLASLVHYSHRLRGGIDIVGISSWITFLQNTSAYRQDLRRAEYGDERDSTTRAYLDRISPLNNVAQITKPLFIIQGYNDPRVPYTEAEQMLAALKQRGIPTWFLMAMDEGHGFRKQSNVEFQTQAVTLFLQEHLLD